MHWYLSKKIEVAGRMLLEGEGSIAEISGRLQFDSPQYFSRIFKRYMGVCPRDYLSKNRPGT
jgi:AraC-like DNA-binding protein